MVRKFWKVINHIFSKLFYVENLSEQMIMWEHYYERL